MQAGICITSDRAIPGGGLMERGSQPSIYHYKSLNEVAAI
jgi:hypothetical protein